MTEKRECPGCQSYSSSVLYGFANEGKCPFCGLSVDAADEIDAVREQRGDDQLKRRVEQLVKENDVLRNEVYRIKHFMRDVEDVVDRHRSGEAGQ